MILFFAQIFDSKFIQDAFKNLGFEVLVESAENKSDFLQKLKEKDPDIIFIRNGENINENIDIVEEVKKITPDTPIVFVVQKIDSALAETLINVGAIDVITEKDFLSSNLTTTYFKSIKISRMRRDEKKLRQIIERGQRFWLSVFDNIPEFAFIVNQKGEIIRCNKPFSSLFNKHPRDLIGKKIDELIPFSCLKNIDVENLCQYVEEDYNGKTFGVNCAVFKFEGEPHIVFFVRDITELKKMREHIFQKDKYTSIGTLASGIAHEINNPLAGIIGFTQMLRMMSGTKENTEILDKILECADRCKRIVESLLIYARQKPSTKSLESVNDVVDRTIDLVSYNLKRNNILIEKELKNIPLIMIDGQQIQQALINIILNAQEAIINAKRSKGIISIKTDFDEKTKKIIIKISDNGRGIPRDIIQKIFDPFFTTKPFGEAMGLGLSIVLGIVKEHNGSINVDTKENIGTTFVIELPVEL